MVEGNEVWVSGIAAARRLANIDGAILNHRVDDGLRTKLSSEIDSLSLTTIESKRRLNACSPLLQLPTEILDEIMVIVAELWPPRFAHCWIAEGTLGWIACGHVCYALRIILLGRGALWARVAPTFLNPETRSELVARAGGKPLRFQLQNFECSHTLSHAEFVVNHLHSAQSVKVFQIYEDGPGHVNRWPISPAGLSGTSLPFLERLHLLLGGRKEHWQSITSDTFELPPIRTPKLRILVLWNYYVSFDASTLTTLMLNRQTPHTLPSAAHVLNILRLCVKLETLGLTYWIPDSLPSAETPDISLPCLTYIYIHDNWVRCTSLWSHLLVPPAARRHFTLVDTSSNEAETDSNLDMLERGLKQSLSVPIHGLCIDMKGGAFSVACYSRLPGSKQAETYLFRRDFTLVLEFTFHSNGKRGLHTMFTLHPTLRLIEYCDIEYLEFSHILSFYTEDYMRGMLRPFINVHTVCHSRTSNSFITCLSVPGGKVEPVLPSLRYLWIERLALSKENHLGNLHPHTFFEMLRSRERSGVGLRRLRIAELVIDKRAAGMSVSEAQRSLLLQLREIVPHVECGLNGSLGPEDASHGIEGVQNEGASGP
ncbi:hypothetical protein K488DRAFT_90426 [Vararia minispora EC-137]|uniref:Uncharacterized protein n=1 Tax=Vararia minispora EC-137 TaxID=1314806 RepID=A0ACB8Q7W5_9AGAM|nr:hypothetical protein K488DRAFT_90426 [Vararia minispora EC-137]